MIRPLFFILLSVQLLAVFAVDGQNTEPTPQSTPKPLVIPNDPMGRRTIGGSIFPVSNVQKLAIDRIYRKPTVKELKMIAPSTVVLDRYKEFLARPGTGIFRLVFDAGCSEDTKVISASNDCLKYTMPGHGSSFSFRTANYRIQSLADLTLSSQGFYVPGELMHGILTNLGDVPIENINLKSPGMRFVAEFQSPENLQKAYVIDETLLKGVKRDGYTYGRAADAVKNSTYVLRVIAYNGRVMRSVNGKAYNELDFDKRLDMTIVFRTIDTGADGSFTIIWIELNRANAPKMVNKVVKPPK